MMEIATLTGLALSTLISEDLATIAAGLLVRGQHLPAIHAVATCVIGIYLGDLGLWWMGRLLRRRGDVRTWLPRRLVSPVTAGTVARWDSRLEEHLAMAILLSRFLPGARLPTYVALGMWGRRPVAFAAWSLLAVLIWTPLLVATTAYVGEAVADHLLRDVRVALLSSVLTAMAMWGVIRLTGKTMARIAGHYHQRFAQTIERPI